MLAVCARTIAGQGDARKALAVALTVLHEEGKVKHVIIVARWTCVGASQGHIDHDSHCTSDSRLLLFSSVRPGNKSNLLSLLLVTAAYGRLCFDWRGQRHHQQQWPPRQQR